MFDKNGSTHRGQVRDIFDPEDKPRRFAWLRSRWVIVLGAVLMGVLLITFGNGSSRATSDGAEAAAQSQNDPLSVRAYQFTGQGNLQGGSGETWIVGGVPVVVNGDTQVDGDIHPADSISLLGHITTDGKWVAERVVPIAEQESFFSFAGPLEDRSEIGAGRVRDALHSPCRGSSRSRLHLHRPRNHRRRSADRRDQLGDRSALG